MATDSNQGGVGMTDLAATALSNSLEGYSRNFYHSQDQRPRHNRMPDSETFDIAGNLWRPKTGLVHVCGILVDGYRYVNVKLGTARVSAPPRVHISVKTRVQTRHRQHMLSDIGTKSTTKHTPASLTRDSCHTTSSILIYRRREGSSNTWDYRKIDSPPIEPFVGLIRLLQY